jgi:4-hydroxybenzoate polyprenyltransferase
MRYLKLILDFYINSSIHVALAVFSLSWLTLIEFDIPYDENVLYFIFFATITGYNFVKYFGLAKFHHRRLASWLKVIQIFSAVSFVLFCYFAWQLKPKTLLYIIGFGIITFLYAIPFLPKKIFLDSQQNLRSISGLKIYVIALVWTGVTVFLPLINNDFQLHVDVFITAFQRFIFVMVLMLPFEIRDMKYDSLKLSTIPQQIGEKNTKLIGVLLMILFFFIEYFKNELNSNQIIILLIVTFMTILFLVLSKKNQGKYYSAFWVESLPIWWLCLLLLFS